MSQRTQAAAHSFAMHPFFRVPPVRSPFKRTTSVRTPGTVRPLMHHFPHIGMAYNAFHSRSWHRFAALSAAGAMMLTTIGVSAQETHYADVEAGVWYEEAAAALLETQALDESEPRLRPHDLATRAEVLKLLVQAYGEELVYPPQASFGDVSRSAWYFPYVEAAARAGWLKGDRDCYVTGARPCTARPGNNVNRAEMAALLQRAYRLDHLDIAPDFPDVSRGEWYYDPVQTAADHCILEGDGGTGRVRPASFMNRAEMVVMVHRASRGMRYGDDCGQIDGRMVSATAVSSDTVEVSFNVDLDANRMDDEEYYEIEHIDGESVGIADITVENARTVRLELDETLEDDETYRVTVEDLRTDQGRTFDSTRTFAFRADDIEETAEIESVTVRDEHTVRVRFTQDVEGSVADDASRYAVVRTSNDAEIDVDSAVIVDDRTVDLDLDANLVAGVTYRLSVESIRPEGGDADDDFDDSMTFTSSLSSNVTIQSATALSNTRLRLTFSEDVDEATSEEQIRYRISGFDGDVDIDSVGMVDDNVVEIVLDEPLTGQDLYTVTVTNLETSGGATFTTSTPFVYAASNVAFSTTLSGANETPAVSTAATGTGTFTLTSAGLQYDITLRNLSGSAITGAHFHRGDVGVAGPVVEPIVFNTATLRATGTWTDLTAEERSLLLDGDIYVNVHTVARPDGEIRGQVIR